MVGRSRIRLFLSYSRADKRLVDRLAAHLRLLNFHVWLDTADIRVGDEWRQEIRVTFVRAISLLFYYQRRPSARRMCEQR